MKHIIVMLMVAAATGCAPEPDYYIEGTKPETPEEQCDGDEDCLDMVQWCRDNGTACEDAPYIVCWEQVYLATVESLSPSDVDDTDSQWYGPNCYSIAQVKACADATKQLGSGKKTIEYGYACSGAADAVD